MYEAGNALIFFDVEAAVWPANIVSAKSEGAA